MLEDAARCSTRPVTKDFKDTLKARMERSPKFRRTVLRGAIECLLAGDVESGKVMIRDYINGTIGFEELGERTQTPPKSLIRMFGPGGNPQAKNLFVIATLQPSGCLTRPAVAQPVKLRGYAATADQASRKWSSPRRNRPRGEVETGAEWLMCSRRIRPSEARDMSREGIEPDPATSGN